MQDKKNCNKLILTNHNVEINWKNGSFVNQSQAGLGSIIIPVQSQVYNSAPPCYLLIRL
jgi:hypothetical protein